MSLELTQLVAMLGLAIALSLGLNGWLSWRRHRRGDQASRLEHDRYRQLVAFDQQRLEMDEDPREGSSIAPDAASSPSSFSSTRFQSEGPMERLIGDAGLSLSSVMVLVVMSAAGMIAGMFWAQRSQDLLSSLAVAFVVSCFPLWPLFYLRRIRLDRIRGQLPSWLRLLKRARQRGLDWPTALLQASHGVGDPLKMEMLRCFRLQGEVIQFEVGQFQAFSERLRSRELQLLADQLACLKESPSPSERWLVSLSESLHRRDEIRQSLRKLAGPAQFQASFLLCLPLFTLCGLLALDQTLVGDVITHPITLVLLVGIAVTGWAWYRLPTLTLD